MSDFQSEIQTNEVRADWIRVRTLILLRWLAIAGQVMAVLVSVHWLELDLPLTGVWAAILASVAFNIHAMVRNPRTKRLREGNAATALLFDLVQLFVLLYLTGGLSNPFCFLVLAPITISATALTLPTTMLLGFSTFVMVSALAVFHVPLTTNAGEILRPPTLFVIGNWVSLIVSCIFVASYARRVTLEVFSMSQGLSATQMALEREQKLTDLGGVVAAAAHELGTPLATIKLVSTELAEELADAPELLEDVQLIGSQADRCRDILHTMGRTGRDDAFMKVAPLMAVIEEAAEPHKDRGKTIVLRANGMDPSDIAEQPHINRRADIIHGLRNLIQNAVDFARTKVIVDVSWDDAYLTLEISDDGRGIPHDLISRIGDPFVAGRRGARGRDPRRPGYKGMGLGLFIAKTLLERSRATLSFGNRVRGGGNIGGAVVTVRWAANDVLVAQETARAALGENAPYQGAKP